MSVFVYTKLDAITLSIIYPESDGQPMTESDPTRDYLIYAVEVLRQYFQSRQQVYVSGNLFIYYREGDPKAVVSPDVLVIFGVSKRQRRSYGGRVGRGWGRREFKVQSSKFDPGLNS